MNKLKCIIHYENQSSYSQIKPLSETNIRRIGDAREKRLEVGGSHLHGDQIKQIPENISQQEHGVHLDPCYKRYVNFHYTCT